MLPYPRASESVKLPVQSSIFVAVVQAIQTRLQSAPSPYVHVTHAVPDHFNLANIPTSPAQQGPQHHLLSSDTSFAGSTVFSSAAAVPAYHDFQGALQSTTTSPTTSLHRPMPVVPPHSVHVSILERYLPPSSGQEYRDLFSADRPSYLVDRLFELSPRGGSMLFVYPTRNGASTFKTQYLGPILDPLLRQLVVVNGLSADVGRYLGKFSSVSHMDNFETMKTRVLQLCQHMSLAGDDRSQFTLVEASQASAVLDRALWTEWFIHQEKARMKQALSIHWQNGRRMLPSVKPLAIASSSASAGIAGSSSGGGMPTAATTSRMIPTDDKEVTAAMLLGEIFDGLRRRPYGEDNEPRDAVELGIFVIRRSHRGEDL